VGCSRDEAEESRAYTSSNPAAAQTETSLIAAGTKPTPGRALDEQPTPLTSSQIRRLLYQNEPSHPHDH
jgi:hypothetical protein